MFANRKLLDAVPEWSDLIGSGKYLTAQPACPSGGVYTLASGGDYPACSLAEVGPHLHVYTQTACTDPQDETARECACHQNLFLTAKAELEFWWDQRLVWYEQEPSWGDLVGQERYLKSSPTCPSGGIYSLAIGEIRARCSLEQSGGKNDPYYEPHSVFDGRLCRSTIEERRCACQDHLRVIQKAKQDWNLQVVIDSGFLNGSVQPTWDDLIGDSNFIGFFPICPDGGVYTLGEIEELPSCSFAVEAPFLHEYAVTPCNLTDEAARCLCQQNLRDINTATKRWMVDNRKTTDDVPQWSDLVGSRLYLPLMPECPSDGVYTLTGAGALPTCSLESDADVPHVFSSLPCPDAGEGDTERDRRCLCQENLRAVETAKESLAMEWALPAEATPTWEELIDQTGYLPAIPICPVDGIYAIGAIDERPTCSLAETAPYLHVYNSSPCLMRADGYRDLVRPQQLDCMRNQVLIHDAVVRWAADTPAPAGQSPTWEELLDQGKYLREVPLCPAGGVYLLEPIGDWNKGVGCSREFELGDFQHWFPPVTVDCDVDREMIDLGEFKDGEAAAAICRKQLQAIDALKQRWAETSGALPDAVPSVDDLIAVSNCGDSSIFSPWWSLTYCSSYYDGSITLGRVDEPPHCSLESIPDWPHGINTIAGAYVPWKNSTRTIEQLRRDDCIANMTAYRDATAQWAVDTSPLPDAIPTLTDLLPYLRYERLCPTGGVYTLAPAGGNPTCSRESLPLFPHVLPP